MPTVTEGGTSPDIVLMGLVHLGTMTCAREHA